MSGVRTLAVVSGLLATACTSTPPLPPAPILSLANRVCDAAPDLSRATPLALDKNKPLQSDVNHLSPCWAMTDGGRSSYAVFGLPASTKPYLLVVDSAPLGLTLFSPKLVLLDAAGRPLRTVLRDQAQFRGGSLTLFTRVHADERYVVVASEPQGIGELGQRIQSSLSVTATSVVTVYSGAETANTYTNAHNGQVTVSLRPLAADAIAKP